MKVQGGAGKNAAQAARNAAPATRRLRSQADYFAGLLLAGVGGGRVKLSNTRSAVGDFRHGVEIQHRANPVAGPQALPPPGRSGRRGRAGRPSLEHRPCHRRWPVGR